MKEQINNTNSKRRTKLRILLLILVVLISVIVGFFAKEITKSFFYKNSEESKQITITREVFVNSCKQQANMGEYCECVFDKTIQKFGFKVYQSHVQTFLNKGTDATDPEFTQYMFEEAPKICQGE